MENSKYDVAKELLAKVGGDASIQYDSTYSIELAMLEKLGGDTNKKFDSEYSIMKDMLTVITDIEIPTFETQSKSIEITTNGATSVTPDEGFDGLSQVSINVNVPSGGSCESGFLNMEDLSFKGSFAVLRGIKSISLPKDLSEVTNIENGFNGCSVLTSITLPELPNATNMYGCFAFCSALTSITLPELPNVTNMGRCFAFCSALTSITLPELSNVTNMGRCFASCDSLTSITLPELPNVTNMDGCFYGCEKISSITIPELPNATNMSVCFYGCKKISSITIPELPNVTNMYGCFYEAGDRSIKAEVILKGLPVAANLSRCFYSTGNGQFTNITLPDLPAVTCMDSCFAWSLLPGRLENLTIGAIGNNITTLSNWGIEYCPNITKESLVNIVNALPNPAVGDKICSIGSTNLAKLTPEEIQVATDKGWTLN